MSELDESTMHPEEIEAAKEGLYEVIATFRDGVTLEKFYNAKSEKEPSRVFARNREGDLIGFTDLDGLKNAKDIKMMIVDKFHIAVTDEEAKKVAVILRENHFQDGEISE